MGKGSKSPGEAKKGARGKSAELSRTLLQERAQESLRRQEAKRQRTDDFLLVLRGTFEESVANKLEQGHLFWAPTLTELFLDVAVAFELDGGFLSKNAMPFFNEIVETINSSGHHYSPSELQDIVEKHVNTYKKGLFDPRARRKALLLGNPEGFWSSWKSSILWHRMEVEDALETLASLSSKELKELKKKGVDNAFALFQLSSPLKLAEKAGPEGRKRLLDSVPSFQTKEEKELYLDILSDNRYFNTYPFLEGNERDALPLLCRAEEMWRFLKDGPNRTESFFQCHSYYLWLQAFTGPDDPYHFFKKGLGLEELERAVKIKQESPGASNKEVERLLILKEF